MLEASARNSEVQVILDHTSAHGPHVTHMRGTLLVNSIDNLRALGAYERYVSLLPPRERDAILFAIATSWLPIRLACTHYEACDRLALDDSQMSRLGAMMATRIADTFLSATIRTTRNAGVDTIWFGLKQSGRLWDRMYQGGGVTVLKTGPKDLIYESHGLPLAESRYWRAVYVHYLTSLYGMFTRVAFVKAIRPRVPHPHCIAITGSWV